MEVPEKFYARADQETQGGLEPLRESGLHRQLPAGDLQGQQWGENPPGVVGLRNQKGWEMSPDSPPELPVQPFVSSGQTSGSGHPSAG